MKIAVIKLGAKGDVVRTLSVVKAIKEKFNAEIHWFTKPGNKDLLEEIDFIGHVNSGEKEFDILYNFDMDDEACELSDDLQAKKKLGFYKEGDYVASRNIGGELYLNTWFDDEIKKSNKKTYQEMMFDLAELPYEKENVRLKGDESHAEKFREKNGLEGKKVIGLHIGAAPRWPSKAWHEDNVRSFIKKAKDKGYEIILFGGPDEIDKHKKFSESLESEGVKIIRNNPNNTDKEFASLIALCDHMVCSDSFSLHVALAMGKKTVGLFFCTTPHEVEGYGLLKKVVAPRFDEIFPEKQDLYDEDLVKSVSADQVLEAIEGIDSNK